MTYNGFSILNSPFVFDANHEPEFLPVVTDSASIIKQDGIHFINSDLLCPDEKTEKELDSKFRNLVESVLSNSKLSEAVPKLQFLEQLP